MVSALFANLTTQYYQNSIIHHSHLEKIVEIANFRQTDRAEVLASVLRSEGIECYVRNEASARTFGGLVDIGARVEVLESDVSRALEIIEIGGFFSQEADPNEYLNCNQKEADVRNSFLSKFSLEKQMTIILVLLAGLIALIIYLGSFLSTPKY